MPIFLYLFNHPAKVGIIESGALSNYIYHIICYSSYTYSDYTVNENSEKIGGLNIKIFLRDSLFLKVILFTDYQPTTLYL